MNKVHREGVLLTVSITAYNHEAYIVECLEGILNQKTNFDFEILLGEDNSTDKTREICMGCAEKYPERIKLFLNERSNVIYINGRPTGRYNFLNNLRNARGKYLALCEGDDYWTDPYKLQKQVDFMEANTDFSICFHPTMLFNQSTKKIEEDSITKVTASETTFLDLAKGNYIHTPSVLFRFNFDFDFDWMQEAPLGDFSVYCLAAMKGKVKRLPDTMAVYRVHDTGLWSSTNQCKKINATVQTLELLLKNVDLPDDIQRIFKKRIWNYKVSQSRALTLLAKVKANFLK